MSSTTPTRPAATRDRARPTSKLSTRLVADDFDAVNALIPQRLTSDVDLVEEIGRHIIDSGGKRLRPLLVLLSARCLGYNGTEHIKLAAIIEFLHTATLLHDDVVDRSDLRRGRATANHLWGNAPSVLVGDFLYSRAFQLMVELGRIDIISILSDATNVIAEGEVQQLANIGNADVSEAAYFDVIRAKTAMLFQAASQTAAVLASRDEAHDRCAARLRAHAGARVSTRRRLARLRRRPGSDGQECRRRSRRRQADVAADPHVAPRIDAQTERSCAMRSKPDRALHSADVIVAVKRCGALDRTRRDAEVQAQRAIDLLTNASKRRILRRARRTRALLRLASQLIESARRSKFAVLVLDSAGGHIRIRGLCASGLRSVAQLGRAPRSGRGGRRFKSSHSDHL